MPRPSPLACFRKDSAGSSVAHLKRVNGQRNLCDVHSHQIPVYLGVRTDASCIPVRATGDASGAKFS